MTTRTTASDMSTTSPDKAPALEVLSVAIEVLSVAIANDQLVLEGIALLYILCGCDLACHLDVFFAVPVASVRHWGQ